MISGILIFNQKGENLIFRSYRQDCRPRLADVFRIQVISNPAVRSPILTLGSTTFSHVKHENIYLVAVTKSNANAALIFEVLGKLVALGRSYFGKFDEEAVKDNFVCVYELLEGMFRSFFLCFTNVGVVWEGLRMMIGGDPDVRTIDSKQKIRLVLSEDVHIQTCNREG